MGLWGRLVAVVAGPPIRSIGRLTVGEQGRAVGTVATAGDLERSPFTGALVVAYRARIASPEPYAVPAPIRSGTPGTEWSWVTRMELASKLPFWVVGDDGARALVDPAHAMLALDDIDVSSFDYVNGDSPELADLLRRSGVEPAPFLGVTGKARFYEKLLRPGDRVDVSGMVGRASVVADGDYRGARESAIAFEPGNGIAVVVRRA